MIAIEEIKKAIENLSLEDFARLREWFREKDWAEWDEQIAADSAAGKLDFLIKEMLEE
jgi:hypothetical protein